MSHKISTDKGILRFTTTGSVDDGKSTLIGRLLYETHCIFEDQYLSIEKTSQRRGQGEVDLSLLLDGLASEREQGITIDVAYRYFATAKRKFIIADCPGHEQYTRNMVTGASNSDLAIILIDARNGVQTQSRRHGFLLSLLQVPHLIVAVNKMDLVDYSQEVYDAIVDEYARFSEKLDIHDIVFIPVSALAGDNVTTRSDKMPWYDGPTLLHHLEHVEISADKNLVDFRFPVQYVMRPHQDFRGYAGRVGSGVIRQGEKIAILPSGQSSTVKSIETYDGPLEMASAGDSVVLTLSDELDISRGDMIVRANNLPQNTQALDAMLCWMDNAPMKRDQYYLLKHTTRTVKAFVTEIRYLIDVNTLHRQPGQAFKLNEIGRIELKTSHPVFFDTYRMNRSTGSFILIDPQNHRTVAAGMIRSNTRHVDDFREERPTRSYVSPNVTWTHSPITREDWESRNRHKGVVLWFTGLSGAGKSTIAAYLARVLFEQQVQVMSLDGDNMRHGLCGDLGFSARDRSENIRRVGETAKLFLEQGNLVICTFISPFRQDRHFVRSLLPAERMLEIYVNCPLSTCKTRDPKGLYAKAERGEILNFTGMDSPYEAPENPELEVNTDQLSVPESVNLILQTLKEKAVLPADFHIFGNAPIRDDTN